MTAPAAGVISAPATPAEVMRRAADDIEKYGWTQHRSYADPDARPTSATCLDGAIHRASGCATAPDTDAFHLYVTTRLLCEAHLGDDPVGWNDHPRRTEAEVVAALRAAADVEEHAAVAR